MLLVSVNAIDILYAKSVEIDVKIEAERDKSIMSCKNLTGSTLLPYTAAVKSEDSNGNL